MEYMAKKKPASRKADRHKGKAISLRLHPKIHEQLKKLVDQEASNQTQEITNAIREHLKEKGLWPPPPEPPTSCAS